MGSVAFVSFCTRKSRLVQLTPQKAEDFYAEHKGKSFFQTLVNFMSSGPIYALVLAKPNAIKEWRALMGPTNSLTAKAEKPKRYTIFPPHMLSCNVQMQGKTTCQS